MVPRLLLLLAIILGRASAGPARPALVSDYDSFTSKYRGNRNRADRLSLDSVVKYFTLGATLYVGNRIAHFIDSRFISKFASAENSSWVSVSSERAGDVGGVGANGTLVEDLKRDQEELWRVVHSMFQQQQEQQKQDEAEAEAEGAPGASLGMDGRLEALSAEVLAQVEEGQARLRDALDKVASRVAAVEAAHDRVASLDSRAEETQDAVTQLREELSQYRGALAAVKESIPRILASHDSKVLERLRAFSAEVKQVLKTSIAPPPTAAKHSKKG